MDKAYSTEIENLEELNKYLGKEIGISEWFEMSQDKVNSFAELTQDKQWIHIDQEKAAKYSPYKKTIAHGFHILSYASQVVFQTLKLNNIALAVNYGLEKVRFPNATPAESKFRGKVSLINIEEVSGGAKYTFKIIFEVEGEAKPVCVAEKISLIYSLPS
jgi:acyl dehydratase